MNADLHMSDVSSSSSDDDPEENPENPVFQPFRPIVVDPESVLADLAASESDQDHVLDSQGLIVDKTTLAGRPVFTPSRDFGILADVSIYETGFGRFGLVIFC